jgi:hypothetical protein
MPDRKPVNSAEYQQRVSKRLPLFPDIVEKLTEGVSINLIARWAVGRCPDLPCGEWSFHYWRKALRESRPVIQREIDKIKTKAPATASVAQVVSEISRGTHSPIVLFSFSAFVDKVQPPRARIWWSRGM